MKKAYALRIDSMDLQQLKIRKNLVDTTLPSKLADFHLSRVNGKTKLFAIFKEDFTAETKIITFKEGE